MKHTKKVTTVIIPYTTNSIIRFTYLFTKLTGMSFIKKHDIPTPISATPIYFIVIAKNFISLSLNTCLNITYGFQIKVMQILLIIVPTTIPISPNFIASNI